MLILDKILSVVNSQGDLTAIHSEDGEISYNSLWEKSDRLANWLDVRLKDNHKPIVVYGHKNPMMIVCFLACAKSGRAYCPVDISMPKTRVEDIIKTVDNPLILATEPLEVPGYYIAEPKLLAGITADGESIQRVKWAREDDLFYIIFTSGSSGKPKGVEITHGNLSRFTDWASQLAGSKEEKAGKIFLNQAPFSFDLSVMDLYTCLFTGGTLWCMDKKVQENAAVMLDSLKEGKINYWISTPSFADMCLADKTFDQNLLPAMEGFLFCGEKLTKETARKLFERFPKTKVINTYGPTESTVAVTSVEITGQMLSAEEDLPIGLAKPGTEIQIDNGEILILGDTVSVGYFKDEEKTQAAFSTVENTKGEKVRCYRTGDAGYLRDGMLYYQGRIDLQIKLHGYRIELGDIESNLLSLEEVTGAAVVPRRANEKIRNLVAFVVTTGEGKSFADGQSIRTRLKERLPEYMVPKKVIFVDSLPMTGNGKTDRKTLERRL